MASGSEDLMEIYNNDYISGDFNFFPLTQLQVGKWLSAFHAEDQIFLYQPEPNTLVFLALHLEGNSSHSSPYLLTYTRKELLKMCKNSPFTAPVPRKDAQGAKVPLLSTKIKMPSVEYGGVVAFEIQLNNIEGLDYSNTLNTYGSRLTLEVNKAKKLWFCNAKEFCKHYEIKQKNLNSRYYNPVLDHNSQCFKPKLIDPKKIDFSQHRYSRSMRTFTEDYISKTPELTEEKEMFLHSPTCGNSESGMNRYLQKPKRNENLYVAAFHECEYSHFTIAAYFDDPIFPYFVKKMLRNPQNKYILTMYERGIPSWAQFLPSYGLPYRPWMRRVMAVIIFIFSIITMLLGFYDLYKNIPQLREVLSSTFGSLFFTFEEAVILRLSVLLGYLIASSQSFRDFMYNSLACGHALRYLIDMCSNGIYAVLSAVFAPFGAFGMIIDGLSFVKNFFVGIMIDLGVILASILHIKQVLLFLLNVVFIIIYQVFSLVALFTKEVKDLILLALSLPFDVFYGVTYGVFDVFYELFSDFYSFFSVIIKAFRYIATIFKNNRSGLSVSESLSIFELIRNFWYDIFRHIIGGITRIYHFVVYISCNIYKYKDSMWVYWENNHSYFITSITNKIHRMRYWILVYMVVLMCLKIKYYSNTSRNNIS